MKQFISRDFYFDRIKETIEIYLNRNGKYSARQIKLFTKITKH